MKAFYLLYLDAQVGYFWYALMHVQYVGHL